MKKILFCVAAIICCMPLALMAAGHYISLEEILYQDHSIWTYWWFAFLAGVGVSFTPCIYPMIPITAGLLHRHATDSKLQNFISSLSYVCGLSSVYALLGFVVAKTSSFFGSWHGSPWFIIPVAAFMFYMAFATLGFYEMYTPAIMTKQVEVSSKKGTVLYLFLMGALSGTVASPCVSPALAALLAFAAQAESAFVGLSTLFIFGLGMSVLLMLVATFSTFSNHLPRAGHWMVEVKNIMGFALIAVGIGYLLPYITDSYEVIIYGMVVFAASCMYLLRPIRYGIKHNKGSLIVGLCLFAVAMVMILDPLLAQYDKAVAQDILALFR